MGIYQVSQIKEPKRKTNVLSMFLIGKLLGKLLLIRLFSMYHMTEVAIKCQIHFHDTKNFISYEQPHATNIKENKIKALRK